MKLGKLHAKHDPRTFKLADHWPVGQISAPPVLRDWTSQENKDWKLYRNLEISDCVIATMAHLVQAWTSMNGSEYEIPEDDVVEAYKKVSGYDGVSPATDVGCVMLDAMRFWRSSGVGGHKILAYVKIDPKNRLETEVAINLFGGIAVGVEMPMASKTQGIWDIAPPNKWDETYRPGSWGGHAMACVGYSRTVVTLVSWGRPRVATHEWLAAYADEAYACISEDWVTRTKLAPNGFDIATLERNLAALV